jgi:hypothetical protein
MLGLFCSRFEIEFLGPRPPSLGRSQPVYALKGPDASTELSLLDLLRSPALPALPLLPHLMGCAAAAPGGPPRAAAAPPPPAAPDPEEPTPAEDAAAVVARFNLNEEQAAVVAQLAAWCAPGGGGGAGGAPPPPICLVHGPFGTGKSTLLVALLHFVLAQRARAGSPLAGARVLVSAHTNVAVDRVLRGEGGRPPGWDVCWAVCWAGAALRGARLPTP